MTAHVVRRPTFLGLLSERWQVTWHPPDFSLSKTQARQPGRKQGSLGSLSQSVQVVERRMVTKGYHLGQ